MTRPIPDKPCTSCPYRLDVASGVWHASEYDKLPPYDRETFAQPHGLFLCHQKDSSVCRGWVDCHGDQLLALRIAIARGTVDHEELNTALNDGPQVPVHASGEAAARHGKAEIEEPGEQAEKMMKSIAKKRSRNRA